MSIVVSSLPAYVEEHRLPLIHKAVLEAKTARLINRQSGVKGTAALNLVNTTPALQADACSWTASGDATLTQRNLVTKAMSVMMNFCDKSLIGKWAEYQVRIAAGEKSLPFEQDFTENIANRISEKVEDLIWKGIDLNNDGTKELDGLIAQAISGSAIQYTPTQGATTYEKIKGIVLAIPAAVLPKAVVFVGTDTYRDFVMQCMEKNLYHYPGADGELEYIFPGTNTKIIAVNGLNADANFGSGHHFALAADPDNLFYGYDVEDADKMFDLWYSKDNKEFRFNCEFNAGTQIAYPNEVVYADLG